MNNIFFQSEVGQRIERLRRYMSANECESCLIVQKVSLYYFSGCDQDAHLYIPLEGEPLLMVRKSLVRAKRDSWLQSIVEIKGFKEIRERILEVFGALPKSIGLEMDVLPVRYYMAYESVFGQVRFMDSSKWVREVRMVKGPAELEKIERAAQMGDMMFRYVGELLSKGSPKDETDLASEIELFYRKMGHMGLLRARAFNSECFYGHVLAGKAGATASNAPGPTGGTGMGPYFSQGAGRNPINRGEPILVDYTSSYEGYVSDQARVFSVGELPQLLRDGHKAMIELGESIMEMARPGIQANEVYEKALRLLEGSKFREYFMGYPDPVPFVGHGVGLELDELPVIGKGIETVLEENMVIALEPKLVIPDYGVVGIENTCVVKKDGSKSLNKAPEDVYTI